MRPTTLVRFVVAAAVAATVVALAPPAAAADLVPCNPSAGVSADGFYFRRCGVPDFDQIRDDLPNDGKMYCFPTSALNWMAYAAERGWPALSPGPGFTDPFLTVGEDTTVSAGLAVMGVLMGTHPTEGSTVQGVEAGLETWTSGFPFGIHTVGPVTSNLPFLETTIENITATAAGGSLTILRVGWWQKIGSQLGLDRYVRDSGHGVSLVGAEPAPELGAGASRIVIHDPAAAIDEPLNDADVPENITHQSPFWPNEYTTVPTVADFVSSAQSTFDPETRDRIVGYGDTGFVDGAFFITPVFGFTFGPDPLNWSIAKPAALDGPDWVDYGALPGLVDVTLAPYGAEHVALFASGDIDVLNSVDGSRRTLTTIAGAQRAAFDDQGRLVVLTTDGIVRLRGDGSADERTRVPVRADSDELAFDPTGGRLVGWDRETNTLTSYGDDLEIIDRQVIPPVVDPSDPETPVTLSIDPTDGTIGLLADGTNRLVVIPASGGPTHDVSLGSEAALAGLVADASGRWYSTTQDDNAIVAFDRTGAPVEGTPFDGMRAGRQFTIWQPMAVGEAPPNDINVLPDDAPRGPRWLEVSTTTTIVAVGEHHQVQVRLADAGSSLPVTNRTLHWRRGSGVHPAKGTVSTDGGGSAVVSWETTTPGDDHLLVWEDLDGSGFPSAGEPAITTDHVTVAEHVSTDTHLAATPSPSTVGEPMTLTAQVSAPAGLPPSGTVTFHDGSTELGRVPINRNGTATLTTSALPAGTHTLTARYLGDALYAASEGATTHAVERIATRLVADPLVVRVSPLAVTLRLSATLTDASGAPIAGEPVRFVVGGNQTCTGVTDANGRVACERAGFPLLLALLNLGYRAVYDGDATYQPAADHAAVIG